MTWRRGTGTKWHLSKAPAFVSPCGIDCELAGMWLSMKLANKDSACKKCWKAHLKTLTKETNQ